MPKGKVTLLGTGTSQGVPIIGCICRVCSSGDFRDKRLRTSALLEFDSGNLLVDVGPDFRQQALRCKLSSVNAALLTHEHKDHTGGLDDLRPFNYLQGADIDLIAWPRVIHRITADYAYAFADTKYPGVPNFNRILLEDSIYYFNNVPIKVFPVMHHKLPVLAFRIGNFAYITDANSVPQDSLDLLQGVDILVLDALQPEPHISHFTLDQAVEFSNLIKPKRTILTHISHKMGMYVERNPTLPVGIELGYDGISFEFTF
jgi:phosphoribosyl 1,2-cyclic phosphate phosphodiesterase